MRYLVLTYYPIGDLLTDAEKSGPIGDSGCETQFTNIIQFERAIAALRTTPPQ